MLFTTKYSDIKIKKSLDFSSNSNHCQFYYGGNDGLHTAHGTRMYNLL